MSYPKRGLSIDLGNEKIKILEYHKSGDKIKIKKALLLDTPERAIEDGVVSNLEALEEVIKDALKEHSIKSRNVIFTIASSKIITRELDLPDLPKKKLDTLIDLNAEEQFPVNLAEYTTDYRIQDRFIDNDESLIRVNIIAAYTVLVNSYLQLAQALGLKMCGVDYAGNSMINYCEKSEDQSTYMLLELGSSSTMVTIMSEGKVKFSRNLVFGTKLVIKSIQNHFGVRYEEAIKIAQDQLLLKHENDNNDFLSNDASGALNQILNGISRLLDFYSSRNKDGVSKIYVSGGGTRINGMESYIAEFFNIDVEKVPELKSVISLDEKFTDNQVLFTIAIGTIYSSVNLLPKDLINKDKVKAANRLRLEVGLLLLLMLSIALYLPFMTIQNLKEEKLALQNEIDEKKIVEPIKAEYDRIKLREAFFVSVSDSTTSTTEIIADVLELMEEEIPTDVYYYSINNTEEGLMITCDALDKLTIINLLVALKDMEYNGTKLFRSVFIPSISGPEDLEDNGQEDELMNLSIICEYNKGEEE